VPVTAGDNTITVIATDQNSGKHQTSVIVTGVTGDNVTLQASPNAGIPTLKASGQTLLDVALFTTTAISNPVKSYAWDFNGSGANQLTCYSHANVTASYEQVGLYLTKVAVTDTVGNVYADTVIVNVVDRTEMNNLFTQKWNSMKSSLAAGNISDAISNFTDVSKDSFNQRFTGISSSLPLLVGNMGSFNLVKMTDNIAECDLRYVKNGVEYSFQVLFIRDEKGNWGILSF